MLFRSIDGIRNLAYDGQYLYAGDYSTKMHVINPVTMKLMKSIDISEYSRHLAYIPTLDGGKGGFEVGDWETSIYMAKDGSKLATGPVLKGASGTAYYDGKLYAFEQGNEANAYTIGIYDMASGERVGSLDMGKYLEIDNIYEQEVERLHEMKKEIEKKNNDGKDKETDSETETAKTE